MRPYTDNVVERPADLTVEWLSAAMAAGTIADCRTERIGTGQMSECYRVELSYAADGPADPGGGRPDSVVLKVAATDPMSLRTVAVADVEIPLPADPWSLHTGSVDFTHSASDPLQTYRIGLHGHAQSYRDPAALLRREQGTPIEVAIDLVWKTDGTPYKYRLTTRYEIPCTVTGTVSVDGHRYTLDSVPGQRDHSWGVRDWWSMDWVWSALHLDDGTHVHAVDIRIPGVPPVGIGYIQDRGAVTELQRIATRETFDANGLPATATLAVDPGGITATVDVRGHAPVRLVSFDGRMSQFPRVWATVRTADGRSGAGWLEWNRNLR